MKIGLVGYQGGGKSVIFELLTGTKADIAKAHSGQVGEAIVPDERYDRLVAHHHPKKEVPAKIQVFDTPGLSRDQQDANAQKLGIIREAQVLVHVVGVFAGADAVADAEAFEEDLILADLQVVNNRVERLEERCRQAPPRPRGTAKRTGSPHAHRRSVWKTAGPCGSWNSMKLRKKSPARFRC